MHAVTHDPRHTHMLARVHTQVCAHAHTRTPGRTEEALAGRWSWARKARGGSPTRVLSLVPLALGSASGRLFLEPGEEEGAKPPLALLSPKSVQHGHCPLEGSVGCAPGLHGPLYGNRAFLSRLERWAALVRVPRTKSCPP